MTYVELHRSFAKIDKDGELSPDIAHILGRRAAGWLTWPDLLQSRRVVLLAEAGSGKTEEFRHQAEQLHSEGRAAFFLPIEELADADLDIALGPQQAGLLKQWLRGDDTGFFFLDSLDEARLNRKRFDLALRRLAAGIAPSIKHARVFVSCRASDWKGDSDRRTIEELLSIPEISASVTAADKENDRPLNPVPEKDVPTNAVGAKEAENIELLIVQLVELSTEQCKTLAAAAGIPNSDQFLSDIERQGLLPLAEWPADLVDLADYYKARSGFRSLAEMTAYNVARKLSEADPYRRDNDTLTEEKAREGAERLAAALTLGKSFTLRVPGQNPDPTLAAGALDPGAILGDWTPVERNALLRRAVFSPATYGRVRFHHRSTQEYLTASWLNRALEKGCPYQDVFGLLFAERHRVRTVVPSLRPAAVWLALNHKDIRSQLLEREPLALVQHGDPGSLPLATKKNLLVRYADMQAAGEVASDHIDHRARFLFANPDLAEAVRDAWDRNDRDDFRLEILCFIRDGRIVDCVDLARTVALDQTQGTYKRIVAVQVLKECGDQNGLQLIARQLMANPAKSDLRIAPHFAEALFPIVLSVDELLRFIDEAPPQPRYSTEGFGRRIFDIWKACRDTGQRDALALGLAELCLKPPYASDYRGLSKRHVELAGYMEPITRQLMKDFGGAVSNTLVRLLMVIERAPREAGIRNENEPSLDELISKITNLNRALFWANVERQRQLADEDRSPIRWWQVRSANRNLWDFSASDLAWLNRDFDMRNSADRRIALSAIVAILKNEGRLEAELGTLRSRIAGDLDLEADLVGYLTPPRDDPEHQEFLERMEDRKQSEASFWHRLANNLGQNPAQLSDPEQLKEWGGQSKLDLLTEWLRCRTGEDAPKAVLQWPLLKEGFGSDVAHAYRDGMKILWRFVVAEPPTCAEGGVTTIKRTTILAYAALAMEASEEPLWATQLTPKEAEQAALHGCTTEQGYPAWLDSLLVAHPAPVLPIIRQILKQEWTGKGEGSTYLYRYGSDRWVLPDALNDELYNVIVKSEPANLRTLDFGIRILHRVDLNAQRAKHINDLAEERLRRDIASGDKDRGLRHLAWLFLVNPERAFDSLDGWIAGTEGAKQNELAELVFGALFGGHDPLVTEVLQGAPVHVLEQLVLLAYQEVRREDDILHEGSYSPGTRDNAEEGRNATLKALIDTPGHASFMAMQRLSQHPSLTTSAHRFRELAREMAERDSETDCWTAAEIREFEVHHRAPAKSGDDLFWIVKGVLADICFDFEQADASSRPVLQFAPDEDAVQNWLAEQLRLRARGRFHVHREPEVARKNKPDVIASSTAADCEVAVEVKHGDKGWSVRKLEEALRKQLAEDYLRPLNRRHGILLVTNHSPRRWQHPATRAQMSFDELMRHLSSIAETFLENETGGISIAVVGINAALSRENEVSAPVCVVEKPRETRSSMM